MICKIMMKKILYLSLLFFVIVSCNNQTKQLEAVDQKADSLSIKLNSPELKAINATNITFLIVYLYCCKFLDD